MSDERWNDVKSRLEGLGLKLKLHLEQEQGQEPGPEQDAGSAHEPAGDPATGAERADDTATGAEGAASETRAAVEDLGNRIQDAFTSFGNAAKDPAVRSDVTEIGQMLKDAMMETINDVRSGAADSGGDDRGDDDTAPPPPPAGPTGTD